MALDKCGGCLFIDRYRSLTRPRTLLSHQIWLDEGSLARWRAHGKHYGAQRAGREDVFEDYRLRVGPVVGLGRPAHALESFEPGIAYNDRSRVRERYVVVVRSREQPFSGDGEAFRSVYNPHEFAFVGVARDRQDGIALVTKAAADERVHVAQLCLVSRDYGMLDRSEAPQYFPPCH